MDFKEVAQVNQISPGTMQSFKVGDRQILIANLDGKFYALNNICPHAGGDLSKGKLEGKTVTCPNHGSKFDVTTGICTSGPKIGFFKLKAKDASAHELKLEGNSIKIAI